MAPVAVARPSARDRADLGRVARGGALNLVGAGFAGVAGFGITWLVARGLDPGSAGRFFAAVAAFTVAATVAKLGTPTGLVYFSARLRRLEDPEPLRRCLRAALTPVTVASVLLGGVLYVSGHHLLAAFLPFAALADAFLAATRGLRQMRPTVLLDKIARPTLQLVALAAACWFARGSVAMVTLAWAVPYVPVALLAARAALRPGPVRPSDGHIRAAPPTGIAREFWRFTAPRAFASIAQQALQRVDVLLLAALAGFTQAAYYAVAGRFVIVGQLANQAISYSVQPCLADLLARGDRAAARALYQSATGWLILLAWPIYLLTAVFAPVYLRLFGERYHAATSVVVLLAVAMLVGSACGMVDMVLAMAGRTTWNLYNVFAALAVNVGVDLVLIPRLGALGAACGLAAAVLVNNLVPLAQLGWALRLHPFGRGTLVAAVLAAACYGVVPVFVAGFLGRGIAGLCVTVPVATALYVLGCWRLRGPLELAGFATLRRKA